MKDEPSPSIKPSAFEFHDLLAYPPNTYLSIDLIIEMVGPLPSHFLWNAFAENSFIDPLNNNVVFPLIHYFI